LLLKNFPHSAYKLAWEKGGLETDDFTIVSFDNNLLVMGRGVLEVRIIDGVARFVAEFGIGSDAPIRFGRL
jgi:hypothetical protein